jgi:hypothetical protein
VRQPIKRSVRSGNEPIDAGAEEDSGFHSLTFAV